MKSSDFSDEEIRECVNAANSKTGYSYSNVDDDLARRVINGVPMTGPDWNRAVLSRAAAILAARKRERLGPWVKCGTGGWHARPVIDGEPGDVRAHLLPSGHWRAWCGDRSIDPNDDGRAKGREACDAALRELGYDLEGEVAVTLPGKVERVTFNVTMAPSAIDRLLCADILRHQPIALQRAIVDTVQAGREVPSRLLWRMELEREPEAQQLRAEVIAGRIRARGWREARD